VTVKSTGASLNDEIDKSCPDGNRRKTRTRKEDRRE